MRRTIISLWHYTYVFFNVCNISGLFKFLRFLSYSLYIARCSFSEAFMWQNIQQWNQITDGTGTKNTGMLPRIKCPRNP